MISAIIGILGSIGMVVGAFISTGSLNASFDLPALLIVVALALFSTLGASGKLSRPALIRHFGDAAVRAGWIGFLIGVIIFWGIMKDESRLIDDQGRELMNVMLTFVILVVVPVIGWLALVVWIPVTLVSAVRGAIATGRDGAYFRYPMTFRFIG